MEESDLSTRFGLRLTKAKESIFHRDKGFRTMSSLLHW